MSALSPRQMFLLDEACKPIREAFGDGPYLVGTAGEPRGDRAHRDVDVRLILTDTEYDQLDAAIFGDGSTAFLSLAIGEYLASRTGLPIDFQIQRMTEANERHSREKGGTSRNPMGLRSLTEYEGDASPAAAALNEGDADDQQQ